MDLTELGREGVDWIDVAQEQGLCEAAVNTILKIWVP
jgi:hypothetical protein